MKKIVVLLLVSISIISCEKEESNNQAEALFSYNYVGLSVDNKDSVIFTNLSKNAISYLWDFGDGTTSNAENPTHNFDDDFPFVIKLSAYNNSESDVLVDTIWGWNIVRKPNIYIYPEETISLCVNLDFPKSGRVLVSEPEYNDGWCITVEPSGKINKTYDFLFYESIQPNIWQTQQGWCVAQSNLPTFFSDILNQYNLSEKERADFVEYWVPVLSEYDYYLIYPQLKGTIDRVIDLNFSKTPDNLFRLFFVFRGVENNETVVAPNIVPANRDGFNIVEWGGVQL